MGKHTTRAAALLAAFALGLSLMIGFATPASAASSCDITFKSYSKVKQGSRGGKAKAVQCLLRKAGYSVKADGSFSAADATKLKRFQRKHKIARSGTATRATWAALIARGSRPSLSRGDRGSSVKRLQAALTAAGYKVKATGHYGPATRSAVKKLQSGQHWRRTGKATSGVWRALQAGGKAKVSAGKASKKSSKTSSSSGKGRGVKALAFAKRQLGDSYRYGGNGPNSWDCSGLTGGAWKAAGVKLPRSASAQARKGKKVSKSNLRPGDLVFFYPGVRHAAIYAGGGKVIHASRPGKPVAYIRMKYMPYHSARRPG